MSLHLDPRQRAMLREMGVRVWQPAEPVVAADFVAAQDHGASAAGHLHENKPALKTVARPPIAPPMPRGPAAPAPSPPTLAPQATAPERGAGPPQARSAPSGGSAAREAASVGASERGAGPPQARSAPSGGSAAREAASVGASERGGPAGWRLGEARALYPQAAPGPGARWLVLAEAPAGALAADPSQGDAGKLLGNMLRAARMNRAGAVLLAPLLRHAAAGATADFSAALAALVASTQPDLVLVMGRLAAQALLPGDQPFGKLRGQVHRLHGANAIVTYDAPYLLRRPADKARAWDDLCLAMSLVPPA